MATMTFYHGSPAIVQSPSPGHGRRYADFGSGFYCTAQKELAKEWACGEGTDGYAGEYELNCDGLNIFRFGDDTHSLLSWLFLVTGSRAFSITSHVAQSALAWLSVNYSLQSSDFDVIIGHRCDDSYFSVVRSFLFGEISLRQLRSCLKFDSKNAEQIAVVSPRAFARLRFISFEPGDFSVYSPRRMVRDARLRTHMRRLAEKDEFGALYMRDIIREGVKRDDPRLR